MRTPSAQGSQRAAVGLALKAAFVAIVLLATAFAAAGCLGGGGGSGGPPGRVEGVVGSSASGRPLGGAVICFRRTGTSYTVYARFDGYFVADLEPATWKVSVAKAGFEGKSDSITVTSGATKTMNVALKPKSGTVTVHGNVNCESLFAQPYPPDPHKDLDVDVSIRGNEDPPLYSTYLTIPAGQRIGEYWLEGLPAQAINARVDAVIRQPGAYYEFGRFAAVIPGRIQAAAAGHINLDKCSTIVCEAVELIAANLLIPIEEVSEETIRRVQGDVGTNEGADPAAIAAKYTTFELSGTVRSALTDEPLRAVNIYTTAGYNIMSSTQTDSDGSYSLAVPVICDRIVFEGGNALYETQELPIPMPGWGAPRVGDTHTLDIHLDPDHPAQLTIRPAAATLQVGEAIQFELTARSSGWGETPTAVDWSVEPQTGNGQITKTGIFRGAQQGTVKVWAKAKWTNNDGSVREVSQFADVTIVPKAVTLTARVDGDGVIRCSPEGGRYAKNESVQLEAVSDYYWEFDHWYGDASGSENPIAVVMDTDKTIIAVFKYRYGHNGYSASGRVTNSEGGAPVWGATINFESCGSGLTFKPVATDSQGRWSSSQLKETVKVVPHKEGWRFEPESVQISGPSPEVNFRAIMLQTGTATVSGTATLTNNFAIGCLSARPMQPAGPALPTVKRSMAKPSGIFQSYSQSDRIQVMPRSGAMAADSCTCLADLAGAGFEVIEELPLTGLVIVQAARADRSAQDLVSRLEAMPWVDWATPDGIVHAAAVPSDYYYELRQWNMRAASLPEAWDITTGQESGAVVAVLDSGIRPEHEDFAGKLVPGWDLTVPGGDADPTDEPTLEMGFSHGTHVAGIIAAATNNAVGVAGASWGASLMPIRVLAGDGRGNESWLAEGIRWAATHGAAVINMSLGMPGLPGQALEDAVGFAYSQGVIMIAAAGNEGCSNVLYPASDNRVIGVSATGRYNELAGYSNYGYQIDIAAPGGNYARRYKTEDAVFSTGYIVSPSKSECGYMWAEGTSMAAPHVSGTAALVLARMGPMSPSDMARLLRDTAVDLGTPGDDAEFGAGLINAHAAVTLSTMDRAVFAVYSPEGHVVSTVGCGSRSDRSFELGSVVEGNHYLVGWLDVNQSGDIDAGDYFNVVPIYVPSGGANVQVNQFELLYLESAAQADSAIQSAIRSTPDAAREGFSIDPRQLAGGRR